MSSLKIYLALYKGRRDGSGARVCAARFSDWLTRKLTRGIYSHCEISVDAGGGQFECYSSSIRDGGVRCKTMPLPAAKWDLIELPSVSPQGLPMVAGSLKTLFAQTQGQRYDLPGVLGVVFKTRQRSGRWFCSEWCGQVLGLSEPWRFSPNDLAAVAAALTVSSSLNESETRSKA